MTDRAHETLARVEELLDRMERQLKTNRTALARSRKKLTDLDEWLAAVSGGKRKARTR